ncbi:haloacid dehalogenase type II [Modestobacter versicolor]|uniref:haloacid dehalogenase type II n=1 Tax=Modestobacter versicolor TaxID=429133 RepID=UPI0034DE2626
MTSAAGTTTLVFDVLGTLLDEDAGHLRAVRELGAEVDATAFVQRWQELFRDAVAEVRAGRRPYATTEALHAEAVAVVGAEAGVPLTDGQVERIATAGRRLDPFPEVVATLGELSRSVALVALTNAGTAQAFAMSAHAGLRWTTLVSGEAVQAFKPDPRMYRHALTTLELDPAECLFVAAHPWDLDAAAAHGMRTGYVDRTGSAPAELADLARRFDLVATDLADLAVQLAG